MPLSILPSDVMLHMAHLFLRDTDAVRLAITSRENHTCFQSRYIVRTRILLARFGCLALDGTCVLFISRELDSMRYHDQPLWAPCFTQESQRRRIGRPGRMTVLEGKKEFKKGKWMPAVQFRKENQGEWGAFNTNDGSPAADVQILTSIPDSVRHLHLWVPPEAIDALPIDRTRRLELFSHTSHLEELEVGLSSMLFFHNSAHMRWPTSLRKLVITSSEAGTQKLLAVEKISLPQSLIDLRLQLHVSCAKKGYTKFLLPSHLESLRCFSLDQPLNEWVLPSTIRSLHLGDHFNQRLLGVLLPISLTDLSLGAAFNHSLIGVRFPHSLRRLCIGSKQKLGEFTDTLEGVDFPQTMESLIIHAKFNSDISTTIFPRCLQHLVLHGEFNQPLENVVWPIGLRTLILSQAFNRPLPVTLPSQLHTLKVSAAFHQSLCGLRFPDSLRVLCLGYGNLNGFTFPSSLEVFDACADDAQHFSSDARRGHFRSLLRSFSIFSPASLKIIYASELDEHLISSVHGDYHRWLNGLEKRSGLSLVRDPPPIIGAEMDM